MRRELTTKLQALLTLGNPAYLPLKLANLALNRLERWGGASRLRSLPLGADIVTTRQCNCRCIMCIGYTSRPPLEMSLPLFNEIAHRLFPTFLYVRFASGGEHFLHPHFRQMLVTCRQFGCPVTIVSNGTLINGEWARFLVRESSVWSLNISFDGARRETFDSIRRGADFERVIKNVQGVVLEKKRRKSAFPIVAFRFVAMRRNIEELPALVHLASRVGVEQVQVAYLTVSSVLPPEESLWFHQDLATRIFEQARQSAKRLGTDLRLPRDFTSTPSRSEAPMCLLPWTQVYIDPSGAMRVCCNAWDDIPELGQFSQAGFREVWNGERYAALRRSLRRRSPIYARCLNCPALAQNPSEKRMHFLGPTQ